MELLLLALLVLIGLQTTYLTYMTKQKPQGRTGDVLLDTSVLIDGRILEIAQSGLMTSRLLVPQSVVRELQFMADKSDHDKRERARFGLDLIEKLQQLPGLTTEIVDDGLTSEHGVDEQLIVIAQRTGAKLCTIDYNLNKAARVQGVDIININELAHALRVVHLPGETISLPLVQVGQDKKQAVGYLDDGTMVVVDDAKDHIGSTVSVQLTRVLQTAAGRMMFAKMQDQKTSQRRQSPKVPVLSPPVATAAVQTAVTGQRSPQPATRSQKPSVRHSQSLKTKPQTQPRNPRRRRQSPEDSMVDLANS